MNLDLVIRGGAVIDGTGAPPERADVGLRGDRIAAVGDLASADAPGLDATGLVIAPGFIDTHTHDDLALLAGPRGMAHKLSQGVTTVVAGCCGFSGAPSLPPGSALAELLAGAPRFDTFAAYVGALEEQAPAVNAALLAGHTHLRLRAGVPARGAATRRQTEAMRRALGEALDAGAIGISTGVYYPDAAGADQAEVVPLLQDVARRGGLYATHLRDEGDSVLQAMEEALAWARQAAIPVVLSHHKVSGRRNHGRSNETLARIEQARRAQPVALDAYPYTAGSTVLLPYEPTYETQRIMVTRTAVPIARYRTRCLRTLARKMGCSIAEAVERLSPAGAVYFSMSERDVRRILAYPHTMVCSDGLPWDPHPHPRLWGAFPRVLGRYARDRRVFPLEEAVRRMTGLPAATYGMRDRGIVAPGAYADLCLFDPATVADRATYAKPIQPAAGIHAVFVNGQAAWQRGALTGAAAGRVLRRE